MKNYMKLVTLVVRTVRKSMESTQKSMRESIEAIYKEKRKVNSK